jgi:ATP-dependent Lon protease
MDKSNAKYNLRNRRLLKKGSKPPPESEDESIDLSESESDNKSTTDSSYHPPQKNKKRIVLSDSEDESVDPVKFRKTLSKLFPSKYMTEKVKQDKPVTKREMMELLQSDKANHKNRVVKSSSSKQKQYKESSDEYESCDSDEDESVDSDDDEVSDEDEEEEEEEELCDLKSKKFNIIFNVNGEEYEDEAEEDEWISEDEDDNECNSDDEKTFMKEQYQAIENPVVEIAPKKSKKNAESVDESDDGADIEKEYMELLELKKHLYERLRKNPHSKMVKKAIEECRKGINKLVKSSRTKNAKLYHKLVHEDKNKTNEINYFKKKFSNQEQLAIMRDLKAINEHIFIEKPYRLAILQSQMPPQYKAVALQKLNVLRSMEPGDPEYYKIKNWVDTFMKIPFGTYKNLSVNIADGIEKCNEFMEGAMTTLNECVYGLEEAKMQIMQMLGQWISNPGALGSAIAIHGPMGSGKTSLVKDGISKIMGREFAFISLGGGGDSSFLEGHSYTYEGSTWGKIVQILIDSKCMNPVIYFDELDKVSDTPRGQEIIGILTHLTDLTQNSQFHDKYFSEIDFDLSKCLFIFSYNDASLINPILRDRMYHIQTKGYEVKDKLIIARNYLLPKIREQVKFLESDIVISDATVEHLISNSAFTKEESGVRNLKRCLEIIYTKLNLFRLVKSDSAIFTKTNIKVAFPMTVTVKDLDALIKTDTKQNQSLLAMYC